MYLDFIKLYFHKIFQDLNILSFLFEDNLTINLVILIIEPINSKRLEKHRTIIMITNPELTNDLINRITPVEKSDHICIKY